MKLGDLVYYFTKYTGIRYIWKKIYPDCKCDKRREEWNDIKIKRWKNLVKMIIKIGKHSYQNQETSTKLNLKWFVDSTVNITNIHYTILAPATNIPFKDI